MANDTIKHGSVFEPGSFFPRSIQELGPVFQFFIGPVSKSIIIADLQEIEDIFLRTRNSALEQSDMSITSFQGTIPYGSVALKTNEMWRNHRRVTAPLMTPKHLNEMTPAIATNARALVAYWEKNIDIMRKHDAVCFSCRHDFAMGTLESRKNVRELTEIGQVPEAAKCMIDLVTWMESVPGGASLPEHELKDEVITFLFGGHDTTSAALQWGVKFLTENPEAQRTLHAELHAVFGDLSEDRLMTYADVTSLDKTPYLEAVVAEVLRCARVAEGTRRKTTAPLNILGHDIPVGADLIFISPTAASVTTKTAEPSIRAYDKVRSETSLKHGFLGKGYWDDDTEEFKPERWIVEDEKTGKKTFNPKAGGSLPFGLGPRSCPGKALAILELKIYLATINLAFFLGPVPKELSGNGAVIQVTRSPLQAYIAPKPWSDA
ncbi:hypothetical protein FRC01_008208 [Tulasnella sp. 417]|nr:hypothetical protein FRC01_008208 [Tulasnella sp. 417]